MVNIQMKNKIIKRINDQYNILITNETDPNKRKELIKERVKLSDVKVGSKITASVSATSTMSIPPQFGGFALRIVE